MIGLVKKLISAIFVMSLLASNVFAADVRLSGNYIFSLTCGSSPSDAVSCFLVYQVKIVPNKSGNGIGKITVVRASGTNSVDTVKPFDKGDILNYRSVNQNLFISNFPCYRSGILDPTGVLGLQDETSSDCGSEKSFDVYYANVDANKIAHYAAVYGVLGTRKVNGLIPLQGAGLGEISPQTLNIILSGTLVRQ